MAVIWCDVGLRIDSSSFGYLCYMSRTLLFSIISTAIVVVACFFPWVTINSKNIVISGVDATGTTFGKPGYLHFILSAMYLLFLLINKDWTKKATLFVAAFNMAWSIRNLLIISTCHGGECPVRQPALYFVVLGSILMLVAAMLAKTVVKVDSENESL